MEWDKWPGDILVPYILGSELGSANKIDKWTISQSKGVCVITNKISSFTRGGFTENRQKPIVSDFGHIYHFNKGQYSLLKRQDKVKWLGLL